MTDNPQPGAPRRLTDEELMKAVPSATEGHEAKVGIFVILGLISFFVVLFWMTDPATLRGRYMLVTHVNNAGGVRSGDPIQMEGVNLGRVHNFEMVGPGNIYITMEIEGEWQIPVGSSTRFGAAGLFGGRTLEVVRGTSSEFLQPGDTIPGEGASGSGLLGSVDELSAQAGRVLTAIESLLTPETVGSIQGSAGELEGLLSELSAVTREQRSALSDFTASLNRSAEGLESAAGAGPDIASAAARADSAMAILTSTSENLDAATESLRSVMARIDAGEGTLGKLTADDAVLYDNLNQAAVSLTSLLDDLQANPNRYINLSIF